MGVAYRIKIKSVDHYVRCVKSLGCNGVQFTSKDEDELLLFRNKKYLKSSWLYIGSNKVAWLFGRMSVVKYAQTVTRKEYLSILRGEYVTCRCSNRTTCSKK